MSASVYPYLYMIFTIFIRQSNCDKLSLLCGFTEVAIFSVFFSLLFLSLCCILFSDGSFFSLLQHTAYSYVSFALCSRIFACSLVITTGVSPGQKMWGGHTWQMCAEQVVWVWGSGVEHPA